MVHRRLVFVLAAFAAFGAAGCRRHVPEQAQNASSSAPAESKITPPIPLPQPKLEREQLIFAALRALSAAALGQSDADAQKSLDGREFELRMRFGCPGAAGNPERSWSYDAKQQVLRAQVSADLSAAQVPASDLLLKGYEGVVGFVVEKPLLLSSGCPAPQFSAAAAPSEPTIALAQLFTSEDSRVQRPEQSYKITKKIEDSEKPTQGLELVIAGRIAELPDKRAIHCAFADGPPACVIAAKLDRVAIENPIDGSVLGEWSQW